MLKTFQQFFDRMNGKMYQTVPPPVQYQFADYAQTLTHTPINNCEGGGDYQLKPLSHEDMGRYAADDVVAHYSSMHKGKNPLRLGGPMSDDDFKKHMGHTW